MKNNIGLNSIDRKDLLTILLLLILSLPLSFFAANLSDFRAYYLTRPLTPIGIFDRFFGMFVGELFFRGFLLFGLSKRFGKWSIVLQDIPYTLAHIGKPFLEIPYSAIGGIVFGTINYRSKSFLPSFLLHAIGSEIFIIIVHLL
ncbi:MAG: CPBP family intramembrane metalloprotease [Candidatus Aenigmarchaeota archaeon]|nr:CPBP family intramembrane metalloprotease [Candidatus Aenigmarchaeota archaeon]